MTQTPSLHLTQPTVGGDTGTWGGEVNLDLTLIDRAVNSSITVAVPDANVILTADGSSSDQSIYARLNFTGALTANRTVTLPANVKIGEASNNTTGGFNIILSAGGTTLAIAFPAWTRFYCDGSNVIQVPRGGTSTNDSAGSGVIGELISSNLAPGSALSLTPASSGNITSINLTAGDWDVSGNVSITFAGVAGSSAYAWINTTINTLPTDANGGGISNIGVSGTLLSFWEGCCGPKQLQLSTTTTVYLGVLAAFTSTATAYGFIRARRVR